MNIAILGAKGRMGSLITKALKNKYNVFEVDLKSNIKSLKDLADLDCVIDFSSPKAISELEYALNKKILTFSGTTGYTKEEIDKLYKLGGNLFYWSCNYAKGIDYFIRLIELLLNSYQITGLIEIHNEQKKDAPSGTALMLADCFKIPKKMIQSLRIKDHNATHIVIFNSLNERITMVHEVLDRGAFVEGILKRIEDKNDDKKTI